jgi:hypothetical protein
MDSSREGLLSFLRLGPRFSSLGPQKGKLREATIRGAVGTSSLKERKTPKRLTANPIPQPRRRILTGFLV